ncbi:uncharacterized protein LOC126267359 [Schistocerca gregaria]|uniref:uncharacterized protein LOC126267359 n=1 Tax=Schistocerca gregaria TaxID=7010 RepID=UPI00211F326E|nr:uncharacterized protein LOC126267359 [Schistocerca gregaria]
MSPQLFWFVLMAICCAASSDPVLQGFQCVMRCERFLRQSEGSVEPKTTTVATTASTTSASGEDRATATTCYGHALAGECARRFCTDFCRYTHFNQSAPSHSSSLQAVEHFEDHRPEPAIERRIPFTRTHGVRSAGKKKSAIRSHPKYKKAKAVQH